MELFIGRIPLSVSVNKISEIFAPYGASNVRMLDGKGCAFANFENHFDAQRAISELNGYQMGAGPGLNVKPAANKSIPMQSPPAAAPMERAPPPQPPAIRRFNDGGTAGGMAGGLPAASPTPQPQLFIGRLPTNLQPGELEEVILPYGAVSVKLLEGKNCAFANFESWAAAEQCIEEVNGRSLRAGDQTAEGLNVKFADMKGVQKGAQQEPKVFMGGLAASVTQEAVQRYCEQFGAVVFCKIFTKNDRSTPCAFVTYGSFTEAERCIQNLNDQEHPLAAEGKVLVVKMADMAKSARTMSPLPPMPGRFGSEVHNAAPSFFTPAPPAMPIPAHHTAHVQHVQHAPHTQQMSSHDEGRKNGVKDMRPSGGGLEEKIFVGGLPEEANEDFLWGMMAPFGRVAEVKLLRKTGATGCGFVSYTNLGEAETAVQALANCRFTVKFADAKGTKGTKRSAAAAFDDDGAYGAFTGARRMR